MKFQWSLALLAVLGFAGFLSHHERLGAACMTILAVVTFSDILRVRSRRERRP